MIQMSQEWIPDSDGSDFVPDSQDSSCSIPYNSHSQKPYHPVVSEGTSNFHFCSLINFTVIYFNWFSVIKGENCINPMWQMKNIYIT